MFKEKCFLRKNSKELWNILHRHIGGRGGTLLCDINGMLLCADNECYRNYDNENDRDQRLIDDGYIDCGDNEKLFLAIAALRDDSDKMQWFVSDYEISNHKTGEILLPVGYWNQCTEEYFSDYELSVEYWHKATTKELIEHFK